MNIENIVQILKDNYNYVMILGVVLIMVILGFVAEKTKFSLSEEDKDEKKENQTNKETESTKLENNEKESIIETNKETEIQPTMPGISSNIDDLIYQPSITSQEDITVNNIEEHKLADVDKLDELYTPLTTQVPQEELDNSFLKFDEAQPQTENKINIEPSKVLDNNKKLTPIKLTPIADESILAKFITEDREENLAEREPEITKIETNNQEETLEEVEPFKSAIDENIEQIENTFEEELKEKKESVSKLEDTMTNYKITPKEINKEVKDSIEEKQAVLNENIENENNNIIDNKETQIVESEEEKKVEEEPSKMELNSLEKTEKTSMENRPRKNKNRKKKKQNNFENKQDTTNKRKNNLENNNTNKIKNDFAQNEEQKKSAPKEIFITSSDEDVWKF